MITDKRILDAIGNTPLVGLTNMSPGKNLCIFAKLEGFNPTGSLKDRIVKYMLEKAEKSGELTKDKILLEATSGNTGISLAMIGMLKGYRVKAVMPENVTPERSQLLELYRAEVVFSPGDRGTNGAIEMAKEMARDSKYHMLYQYGNEANPLAHYETTAVEILREVPHVDVFVAGLGTGGTLMGVGRRLKEVNPETRVIAVVPHPGEMIDGLRSLDEGFIPPILDAKLLDGRIIVNSLDSFIATKELTQKEGIFAGISSGAVMHGVMKIARKMESGNIVALFADSGWKYLSTGLWTGEVSHLEAALGRKVWW